MAYKAKNVPASRKSIGRKGSPVADLKHSGDVKVIDHEQVDRIEEFSDKYMEDIDKPAHNVVVKHPNRNYNKPDIDKPAY